MDVELLDSIDDQLILISGGNLGPSTSVAANLEAIGGRIYVGYRNLRGVKQPPGYVPVELDLREPETIQETLKMIEESAGRLDVLISDAPHLSGVNTDVVRAAVEDGELADEMFLDGPRRLVEEALPLLREAEAARVVLVAHGAGVTEEYPELKNEEFFEEVARVLQQFVQDLDEEYGDEGLMINAVMADDEVSGADTTTMLARLAPGGPSGRTWRDRDPLESDTPVP